MKIEDITNKLNTHSFSTVSSVISKIMAIIIDERSHAGHLAEVFQNDAVLSAKLLKTANSALFSRGKKIDDLKKAIIRVGFNEAKEIAISVAASGFFESDDTTEDYSRFELWKNSLATAICNKLIYRYEFKSKDDTAYLAGLFHNIGILIEDELFNSRFKQTIKCKYDKNKSLIECESELLGMNHEEIGTLAGTHWNFPECIIKVIGNHHSLGADPECDKMIHTTRISQLLAHKLNIGYTDFSKTEFGELNQSQKILGLNGTSLAILSEELRKNIVELEKEGWFI